MASTLTIPLGVIVTRLRIADPWQEFAWRPESVFLGADPDVSWKMLREAADTRTYHAGTMPLELHRKEAAAYRENLASGRPSVFVVLRDAPGEEPPVRVALVTPSPHEVQAYGLDGSERTERVAMPEPLVELLAAFVEEHDTAEPFVKRQRTRDKRREEAGDAPPHARRDLERLKRGGPENG